MPEERSSVSILHALSRVVQATTRKSRAHTVGQVVRNICEGVENEDSELVEILLDTGALGHNYVKEELFRKIEKDILPGEIEQRTASISLASEDNIVKSQLCVRMRLEIRDSIGNYHPYSGKFLVLPKLGVDVIVGLPAILEDLWDVFVSVLRGANSDPSNDENMKESEEQLAEALQALMEPWQKTVYEEAPEDSETPLPAQFEFAQEFLGKSREEATEEFLSAFEEHITPEFRAATNVEELLRTKGVQVFVPTSWDGIKMDPIDLEFDESMPSRMKPPARPVNPRLFADAEKEFKRLCTYFYEPCRSPWASCLVIAPKATKPFIRFCGDYVTINGFIKIHHYQIPMVRRELERIAKYRIFLDIDMTNAFHQLPITKETSERLSVQTPWGQFRPKFVPEGIERPTSVVSQPLQLKALTHYGWGRKRVV